MRGQTGRRGLEAEAWGEGIQQILWNSIGGGRPQSGLDFQPSRPSWHSFQAQNVISVRGSGPRNKGGHDVTSVSVGTLPRTNGTWGAGDAPRLPIMGSRCFSHSTRHGIFDLQSCPSHVGWRMSMSLSCHGSPAFHLRESFTGGGCRLAATVAPRREKLFSFAVCHQQDSHPGVHDADKLDANWTLFWRLQDPFFPFPWRLSICALPESYPLLCISGYISGDRK